MPAILIQTVFLSNPHKKNSLFRKKYREYLSEGIFDGILTHIKNIGNA
jgi:N-acetylmuramoyl-L-alanine amidase